MHDIIIIVKVLGLNRPLLVSGAKKALIWALKGTVAKRPVYRVSTPKTENSVINYSPSCRSKPIQLQNTNDVIFDER